jgi:hypothetical protein
MGACSPGCKLRFILQSDINTLFNALLWILILLGNIVESIIDALERVRVLELEERSSCC